MLKYISRVQIKNVFLNNSLRRYNSIYTCILHKSLVTTETRNKFLKHNLVKYNHNYNLRNFTYLLNHKSHVFTNNTKSKRLAFTSQQQFESEIENVSEKKELEILSIQFPAPKNVLHNYFNIVAQELKSDLYKVSPQFKSVPVKNRKGILSWVCTYSIKWPEELKFHSTALNKQDASYKAAYKVLSYLQKSGKILKNGLPLVYDKPTVKSLVNESNYLLVLNESVENKLNEMYRTFETNLMPYVVNEEMQRNDLIESETSLQSVENDLSDWTMNKKKIISNLNSYSAKEAIRLPIQDHRKDFEELLENNRIVIIRGEPGCGKSTRIPQYVLEHWIVNKGFESANIVVTQPRRIAAISLAERVAYERKETVGQIVGYHVRLNSKFNQHTGRILYCTTGILLRQLQADASLKHCSHVILDEAHERDVNTDLLMNLMREALNLNPTLKLVIMSATIDVGLFQKYFRNPPVMNIPGFTHPVKVHFLDDIKLNLNRTRESWASGYANIIVEDVASVIQWIDRTKPEGAILCFLPGWDEISKVRQLLHAKLNPTSSFIVSIHSKLSQSDQHKIFKRPPPGVRKVILATNIAETSVTVDDVVYVVDSGIHKETRFDPRKGVGCIDNHCISQSSMNQRKGRAGRVQPGESFHLYPKAKFDAMEKFSVPEILRVSLTKIVLDAKVYSHNMKALEFFSHLPCPPQDSSVAKAVQELQELNMLDVDENLTPLGRVVSDFQLVPKLSKAMIQSVIYKCVVPIVDIATLYSSDSDMFATTLTDKEGIRTMKKRLCQDSDHIALVILYEQWADLINDQLYDDAEDFCVKHNLVYRKLLTLKKLKEIHYDYLATYLRDAVQLSNEFSNNKELIKGVLLSGVGTTLLHRNWDMHRGRLKKGSVFITKDKHKATITTESVNHKKLNYESPFLLYINETHSEMRRTTIIRESSVIHPLTFVLFKNCDIAITEVQNNAKINIDDPVMINLLGTNLRILCNRRHAIIIRKCKHALNSMENYFVYHLTKGGSSNPNVLANWDKMLELLNDTLKLQKCKENC